MQLLAITLLGATAPVAVPTQTIAIEHRGTTIEASYGGSIDLEMRQTGFTPPNRPGTARCTWKSILKIDRSVTDTSVRPIAPLGRKMEDEILAQGWRPGGCMETATAIRKDAAKTADRASDRIAAIVGQDRVALAGELAVLKDGLSEPAD